MKEARAALGLDATVDELLERAAIELSFDQGARAGELCDLALEVLPEGSERRGVALYLRGLARDDAADLSAAVAALEGGHDVAGATRARLALARIDASLSRGILEDALARLAGHDLPLEAAEVLLALGRIELTAGTRVRAAQRASEALDRLRGVLRLEARRLEVLAIELQADAAEQPPEAVALLDEAIARAERMELGRVRVLRDKRAALEARQGPFR